MDDVFQGRLVKCLQRWIKGGHEVPLFCVVSIDRYFDARTAFVGTKTDVIPIRLPAWPRNAVEFGTSTSYYYIDDLLAEYASCMPGDDL